MLLCILADLPAAKKDYPNGKNLAILKDGEFWKCSERQVQRV